MTNEERKKKLKAIKFYISESENETFRKNAMMKYGYAKGSISQAAEEAICHWNKHFFVPRLSREEFGDPIAAIEGLLQGKTTKTSIELQHEASKIRAEKYEKERKKWSK